MPEASSHLGERHVQAAVGKIVAGCDPAARDRIAHELAVRRSSARSTGGGAPSSRPQTSRR